MESQVRPEHFPMMIDHFVAKGMKAYDAKWHVYGMHPAEREALLPMITGTPASATRQRSYTSGSDIESAAHHEWDRSAAIREEFGSKETFIAYKKATTGGLVKHYGRP